MDTPLNSVKTPLILVVDDHDHNIQLVCQILATALTCEFAIANHGEQALHTIREQPPDLVLLDAMMPGMDGFEVAKILQANPATASIPIIFLTARNEDEDIERGFKVGAVDYITKPIRRRELVSRVATRLKIQGQQKTILGQKAELAQLVHILCHDLVNPIGCAQSFMELAMGNHDAQERDKFLRFGNVALETALEIVGMVRDMRKLEEKGNTIRCLKSPLAALVEDALFLVGPKADAKEISMQANIASDLAVLVEPVSFVNSVLANLLTNAIKFSQRGSFVQLEASRVSETMISLEVMDQGVGIPPSILEVIFNVEASTSRSGTEEESGTGYGMPLAKRFVEAYGGSICVSSAVASEITSKHGTTITLHLPAT